MTDAKTAELVVQKLDLAIATASNDDYSKPMTTERFRHSERIAAMAEGRDLIEAQAKEIVELREALVPFSDAIDSLHDKHADRSDIWESPAAIDITAGDLRRARAALSQEKSNGE